MMHVIYSSARATYITEDLSPASDTNAINVSNATHDAILRKIQSVRCSPSVLDCIDYTLAMDLKDCISQLFFAFLMSASGYINTSRFSCRLQVP